MEREWEIIGGKDEDDDEESTACWVVKELLLSGELLEMEEHFEGLIQAVLKTSLLVQKEVEKLVSEANIYMTMTTQETNGEV